MKPAVTQNLFTSLSHDAMFELVRRLPAAGSTTPWRDLGSLASTCQRLSKWKKGSIGEELKLIWAEAGDKIPGPNGWRHGLQIILNDFQDPSKRLFQEPVLRKVARLRRVAETEQSTKNYPEFMLTLYAKREAVTLKEISHCFDVFSQANEKKRVRLGLALPSLILPLKSADRLEALRRMFQWLDADKDVCGSIRESGIFQKILDVLGEDERSKALLELGLSARGLLPYKLDLLGASYSLSYIPDEQRWTWVSENIPEFRETTFGMQVLLADRVCKDQLIEHLNGYFSDFKHDSERVRLCARVFSINRRLAQVPEGKAFIKTACKWFMKAPQNNVSDAQCLDKAYLQALVALMPIAETYLGKNRRRFLFKKAYEIVGIAMMANKFRQSTSLLLNMARHDPKLRSRDLYPIPKAFWKSQLAKPALLHALKHATDLPDENTRHNYVGTLTRMAYFVFDENRDFYDKFKVKSYNRFQDRDIQKESNGHVQNDDAGSES